MCMEEPGGTANEAPPPRRGHPRGVVITSILGRAAKTPLILPIRITIGRVSVNCEIEDPTSAWPDFVELDSDFTMLQLLEAWLTYPDSQLDHSGLRRAIDAMIEDLELYFDEGRDALLAAHEALDEVYPGGLGINGRALIEILGTVRSQGFRD